MAHRTFFERFGHHGICVLPAEVLSDDPLTDPEKHEIIPSVRQHLSAHGLCYAQVLKACGDHLYWATMAATPDLANAERVLLSEAHLRCALPWDIRLVSKCPGEIRRCLFAHAAAVQPLFPHEGKECEAALTPAPVAPLKPLTDITVVVTADELQAAFGPCVEEQHTATNRYPVFKQIGSLSMQQAFFQVMIDTLMERLYAAKERVIALALKARCATIALLQRWHRYTHQQYINASPVWSQERQSVVWQLTVGVPASLQAAA